MKLGKFLFATFLIAIIVCMLITVGMTVYQSVIDVLRDDNTQTLMRKAKYNNPARLRGLNLQPGEFTGYGSIELLAHYFKLGEPLPEKDKERLNNRDFRAELQKVFPDYNIAQYSNLRNTELLDLMYDSLAAGNPAIIFHAAEQPDEENFEMRYSVVIGVNLPNNQIILLDPYGVAERYTIEAFIKSARFGNYEVTLYERLLFAFRIYSKNTVYIISMETD